MDRDRSAELGVVDSEILLETVETGHRNRLAVEDIHEAQYPKKRLGYNFISITSV